MLRETSKEERGSTTYLLCMGTKSVGQDVEMNRERVFLNDVKM